MWFHFIKYNALKKVGAEDKWYSILFLYSSFNILWNVEWDIDP